MLEQRVFIYIPRCGFPFTKLCDTPGRVQIVKKYYKLSICLSQFIEISA